jgi:chromosome segregation ATPase
MSTPPADDQPARDPQAAARPDAGDEPGPDEGEPKRRRNPWIWISAALALVAVGLLVWAVTLESDNDSAQQQLASTQMELSNTQEQLETTQQELDSAKQEVEELQSSETDEDSGGGRAVLTAGALAGVKALIDDLEEQLGTTQDDLAAAEQDLKAANDMAEQAADDAAAAEDRAAQASDETEKAQAEADQARAEAQAAESRAAIAADCARAFVTAIDQLLEGDEDQADAVREQVDGITAECKTALADS